MRGKLDHALAFAEGFAYQCKITVFEIAQPSMRQPPRPCGDTATDVVLLEHGDAKATMGGVPGDAQTIDAGPNDDDVEGLGQVFHGKRLPVMATDIYSGFE
jgi:hypothetical protein